MSFLFMNLFVPSFYVGLKMQTNCFQEHPEAVCVTRCVVNTLFSIGASLKYMSIVVMERDWTLSGSLLASCLLQLMEIYILEYNLNIKVYTLHFLLIYIERDREIIFKKIKNPSPLSLCVLIFFCVVKMYVYFYIAKNRHHFYN